MKTYLFRHWKNPTSRRLPRFPAFGGNCSVPTIFRLIFDHSLLRHQSCHSIVRITDGHAHHRTTPDSRRSVHPRSLLPCQFLSSDAQTCCGHPVRPLDFLSLLVVGLGESELELSETTCKQKRA